jgi:hypothetical protein
VTLLTSGYPTDSERGSQGQKASVPILLKPFTTDELLH